MSSGLIALRVSRSRLGLQEVTFYITMGHTKRGLCCIPVFEKHTQLYAWRNEHIYIINI